MGAATLTFLLANEGLRRSQMISAAVVVQAPMILQQVSVNLNKSEMGRFYNRGLCSNLTKFFIRHCEEDPKLISEFKSNYGMNIMETI